MNNKNLWEEFFVDLINETKKGFLRPAPTLYFLTIIILVGGLGVWLPWIIESKISITSVITYILALLSAVFADFLLRNPPEEEEEYSKDLSVFVFSILVIICCLCVVIFTLPDLPNYILIAPLVLVWWLWWILLEPHKFGLNLEEVQESLLGSGASPKNVQEASLDAFFENEEKVND